MRIKCYNLNPGLFEAAVLAHQQTMAIFFMGNDFIFITEIHRNPAATPLETECFQAFLVSTEKIYYTLLPYNSSHSSYAPLTSL